jgi:hypothetical protein
VIAVDIPRPPAGAEFDCQRPLCGGQIALIFLSI